MKKIYLHLTNKQLKILKICLCLSCPFVTLILSNRFELSHIFIGVICSFVVSYLVLLNYPFNKKINKKKLIISLLLGIFILQSISNYNSNNMVMVNHLLKMLFHFKIQTIFLEMIIEIFALPAATFFVYWFINNIFDKIISFFQSLSKSEKRYLYIVLVVAFIISSLSIYYTNAFSHPQYYNQSVVNYDVIYTSDSGALLHNNCYLNVSCIENDVRQPLFGLFALPFGLLANFISKFFFIDQFSYSYELLMTVIQYVLISISTILLGRLLNLKEENKKYFYLLLMCSFSYLLFSFLLEQYVISLFYLILAIYIYYKNPNKINYSYIGAVGTLITTGIIFPFITKFKSIKQWLKDVFKCFIAFLSIFIVSGQVPQLITMPERFTSLLGEFAEKLTFMDKLYQYTYFIKGIFVANPGHFKMVSHIPRYQLYPYNSICIIGIVILIVCILGFVLNYKNRMAIISILWILFSIVLLLIIGWGTTENGLILYSLYFAWAYLVLYYLLLAKIFNNSIVFKILIILSCIVLLIFNIRELINIFAFAIKYYGVV